MFKGIYRLVENVDCFDWVNCANKCSERQSLDKVYEVNGKEVKMNLDANGNHRSYRSNSNGVRFLE